MRFFSLLILGLFPCVALASGRISVSIDESTLQKSIDRLYEAGVVPTHFGDTNSNQSVELNCLAPEVRFPRVEFGEALEPRLILGFVCSMKSAKYKFAIACDYRDRASVPSSFWDPRNQEKKCPMIQVSLTPVIETSTDGTQNVVFKALTIDRLVIFTDEFSTEVTAAAEPVIQRVRTELNAEFEQFGNPWFRSLSPFPVSLNGWDWDFKAKGKKTQVKLQLDDLKLNAASRKIQLGGSLQVVTP